MKVFIIIVIFFAVLSYAMPWLNSNETEIAFEHFGERVNRALNNFLILLEDINTKLINLIEKIFYTTTKDGKKIVKYDFVHYLKKVYDGYVKPYMPKNLYGRFYNNKKQDDEFSEDSKRKQLMKKKVVIELVSGQFIEAFLLGKTESEYVLEIEGVETMIYKDEVKKIDYVES